MCGSGSDLHCEFELEWSALMRFGRGCRKEAVRRAAMTAGLLWVVGVAMPQAMAEEFRPLYRGARAQAMGNAFTAIADDEQAIFYNPAGLANIQGYSFKLATANLDVSNDLYLNYAEYTAAFGNLSLSTLNTFVGKNLYLRAQGASTFVGPNFGIAGIYDAQGALRLQNIVFPEGQIGATTTYGAQFAFAIPYRLRKIKADLNIGIAGKVLYRSGNFFTPTMTDLMVLNSSAFTPNLSNPGLGIGLDLGVQYIQQTSKNVSLLAGFVLKDIGDTAFASGADSQKSEITAGLGLRLRSRDLVATLAYDYAHISDYADWRKKTHLGMELKFPILSLYGGLSQLNLTYGLSLDLWLIKVMYVSYAEEQGTTILQNPERRTMVQFTFKLQI